MTTPIAAPAEAPIGPNIAPAFAPSMAELTASMATFKPSAISPNAPPNESPSFEKVSERNCPDRMISPSPSSISSIACRSFFVSLPASNMPFRPLATFSYAGRNLSAASLFSLSASEISFSLSGDLLHSSNVSFVIPKSLPLLSSQTPLFKNSKASRPFRLMASNSERVLSFMSPNNRLIAEVVLLASMSRSDSSLFMASEKDLRSPSVVALAIFSL